MRVYNRSQCFIEPAQKVTCPRCKGSGGTSSDKGEPCTLCEGKCKIWQATSGSGWVRVINKRIEDSKLY